MWSKGKGYIEHLRPKLSKDDFKLILALFDMAYTEGKRDELEHQREDMECILCGLGTEG